MKRAFWCLALLNVLVGCNKPKPKTLVTLPTELNHWTCSFRSFEPKLLQFPRDADYGPSRSSIAGYDLLVHSTINLSRPRSLVLPEFKGVAFRVFNETLGAQSITIGNIVIPNGSVALIANDGEAYRLLEMASLSNPCGTVEGRKP